MEQVDARRESPQTLVWKRLVSRLSAEGVGGARCRHLVAFISGVT